ncbi:MAG: transporter substrate-binding domain-containing protein [Candidatus Limnocylindria bacterium]
MTFMRRSAVFVAALLILAACQAPDTGDGSPDAGDGNGDAEADGQLARILEAGVLVISTDPAYPPQSSLNSETGEYEGFDIDVAIEVAERLGVDYEFTDPTFDAVVAGSWSERWDVSVGSVTITEDRMEVLDFTQPYYYTPAQMATTEGTDIASVEDFAGTTICVAEATTYLDWLEGTLTLPPDAGDVAEPPEGATGTTLPTDINCAEAWQAGRTEFEGWISSITTVQGAIDEGYPVTAIGDPVFFEPLAVAFDKAVEDNDSLVARVDEIIGEMHEDGTLTALSEEWYGGLDLTTQE